MYIGVLFSCEAYLNPAQMHVHVTPVLASTEEECVQNVWHLLIDECISVHNLDMFMRYTIEELPMPVRSKFEAFLVADEDMVSTIQQMRQVHLTRQELEQVLTAYYQSDYYHEVKIMRVSMNQ